MADAVELAWRALRDLNAPWALVRHAELVLEAAELLVEGLRSRAVPIDADFVRAGAVLHDAGKARHQQELTGPGKRHETDGPAMLEAVGVPSELAAIAATHAAWAAPERSLEERLVTLADKLWKGSRRGGLEQLVVAGVAARTGRGEWDVLLDLDPLFADIARDGTLRLARAQQRGP